MRKSSVLLLFLLILTKSYAQDLQVLMDSSTYYWENEQYPKAYEVLSRAVDLSKGAYGTNEENGAVNYAYVLNQMGIRLYQGETYETAVSYYDAAISIYKDIEGESSESYLASIENLALCYNTLGNYQEALQLYAYLLENEKYLALSGNDIFQTYNTAGICAYQVDDYEVAKTYYQKALSFLTDEIPDYWVVVENLIVLEKDYAQYTSDFKYLVPFLQKFPDRESEFTNLKAYYFRDLGNAAFTNGEYVVAVSHLKNALSFLVEEDSVDRITKIYGLEGLSAAFINAKMYADGLPYLIENEKATKFYYSENSDEYLYALNYLSVAYTELGDYKNASRIYRKAYKVIDKSTAQNSGEMRLLFDINYADYLVRLGKYSEARTYAIRALVFYESDKEKYFDDLVYSMNQIGLLLTSSGKYEKAEALFKQTLNMQKEKYGLENTMSTTIASNLTSLYIQAGRNSRALQFLNFILANDLAIHAPNSYEYSFSQQIAGVLYTTAGENKLAIDAFNKSYEIRKSLVGDKNREVLRLKQSLGTAYFKAGKLEEAEKILTEIMEVQKATLGSNNFDISMTQNNLGMVYHASKDYQRALKLFDQSYSLKKKILGQYNQFTVTSLYNMAATSLQLGQTEKALQYFNQSISDYLVILEEYFPYLSEKERLEYYHTIKGQLGAYFSFLNSQLDDHPEYASLMYDTQMKTKAMLLNESMELRNFLSNHKDENIKKAYKQWVSINEEVAKLEQTNPLGAQRVYLDSIKVVGEEYERVLNSLPGIATQSENVNWKDIAASLKDGEVAIEMIRVNAFDFETNQLKKEDINYIALIIDNKTTDQPMYVRLDDGFLMDSKHFNQLK